MGNTDLSTCCEVLIRGLEYISLDSHCLVTVFLLVKVLELR